MGQRGRRRNGLLRLGFGDAQSGLRLLHVLPDLIPQFVKQLLTKILAYFLQPGLVDEVVYPRRQLVILWRGRRDAH